MQRLPARTTWYVYEAVASFLGMLAFTVTAVYYVTEVGMSPSSSCSSAPSWRSRSSCSRSRPVSSRTPTRGGSRS